MVRMRRVLFFICSVISYFPLNAYVVTSLNKTRLFETFTINKSATRKSNSVRSYFRRYSHKQ